MFPEFLLWTRPCARYMETVRNTTEDLCLVDLTNYLKYFKRQILQIKFPLS